MVRARRVKVEDEGPRDIQQQTSIGDSIDFDDGDGDEIVREIDVFVSDQLSQQLYLLQYPLQQAERTVGASSTTGDISHARIKRKHGLLEIEHPLPNTLDKLLSERSEFSHMTHRTFQSTTIPVTTHLLLGKFSDPDRKLLHLFPLNTIRQMRPTFRHIDDKIKESQDDNVDDDDDDGQSQQDVETKPVVFQRKESERAAMARKSSYAYLKSSIESEPWDDLLVHETDSEKYQSLLKSLTATSTVPIFKAPSCSNHQSPESAFVDSLNYLSATSSETVQFAGDNLESLTARLVTVLKGSPVPYSLIRAKFDYKSVNDDTLLEALSVCAVMVRGNYCLNSRFMTYLSESDKRTRNLILLLLHEQGIVRRKPLLHVLGATQAETVLVLLRQVAKQVRDGWNLKVEDDNGHIEKFPKNYQTHKAYWARQAGRYNDWIKQYGDSV